MPYIARPVADAAQITIVVPCYNEARRLPVARFRQFVAEHPAVEFLFVNDGSTDDTAGVLHELIQTDPQHYAVLEQSLNQGKAEAVRKGMLAALARGSRFAGYWDADLATPLSEIPRFVDALESNPSCEICFGSRVRLLGRAIERKPARHYLGRLFATAASFVLDLPVYDTQCGAKLFRVTSATRQLFSERFCVNWTFDVEIIARVQSARNALRLGTVLEPTRIYELPLNEWRDVAGSKVQPTDFVKALLEMLRIYTRYGRGGRKQRVQVPA
jgi:dolichyl-phosphate beta-glucosyltransferase